MKTEELSKEALELLTPETAHTIYVSTYWQDLFLQGERPSITVDQFDDLWASYFDTWGIMNNPVRDESDFNNRLATFDAMLGHIALNILPYDTFKETVLKDKEPLTVITDCMSIIEEPSEKKFFEFRKKLIEKLEAYWKEYGHPSKQNKQ